MESTPPLSFSLSLSLLFSLYCSAFQTNKVLENKGKYQFRRGLECLGQTRWETRHRQVGSEWEAEMMWWGGDKDSGGGTWVTTVRRQDG